MSYLWLFLSRFVMGPVVLLRLDPGGKEAQHSGSSSHSHVSFCVSWALSLKQLPDKFKMWGP